MKIRALASANVRTAQLSVREKDQPGENHRQHPNDDNEDAEQPLATHRGSLHPQGEREKKYAEIDSDAVTLQKVLSERLTQNQTLRRAPHRRE